MKRKILSIVSLVILTMVFITSCASSNTPSDSETTKLPQEIELEYALKLEEEGAWTGAYCLFDDLVKKGYYPEYDTKRDELYNKYQITQLVNFAINYNGLKDQLKNPNSLIIYNLTATASVSEYNNNSYVFEFAFEYGATNSFGGMVRDTYKVVRNSSVAKEYIGKNVDISFISLDDIAEMDFEEFEAKMNGDFKIYHSNFINDVPNNIWIGK